MPRNLRAVAKSLPNTQTAPAQGGFNSTSGVAGYGAWAHGRGLPRQPSEFLTGAFGPLMPMQPAPIDAPDPGSERPDPRRSQYPVGWNMPVGTPGSEGLKLASFANLRTVADTYSVARACIEIRIKEILGLEWDITPTKDAEKKMRGDKEAHREFGERRAKALKFFKKPDPNYNTFHSWMNAILEDLFVVDALSLYLHPSRKMGKGLLGSNLAALDVIDGTTVRPLLDLRGGKPLPPNVAYQTYEYGVPRVDLMTALDGADLEEMGDAKAGDYRGDQLLYLPYQSRSWTPYGFPGVERSLVPTLSGIQRQRYQLDYFSEGTIPGVFISSGDPGSTPGQLRELQDALNAMAGDPAWKHKIIVIPKDSKIDAMRPVSLADQFDEIIMTQVCMAFEVMPMELGISPKVSTTQSPGAANQMAKASADINMRKALKPCLLWLKASIFDYVLQSVCGMDDMQWTWQGLEQGEDESATVAILKDEIASGLTSIDEGRVARGKQPWGLPITSDPVYFTGTGIIPIAGLDPETGRPKGDPAPGAVPPGANPAAGQPTQPAAAGAKPTAQQGTKQTPGHSAASGHDAQNAKPAQAGSADKAVNTVGALRELDLIRRRLNKGRSIDGWVPEHLPGDVFATLAEGLAKFDPRQPRDPRGRWTAGGTELKAAVNAVVDRFQPQKFAGDKDAATYLKRAAPRLTKAQRDALERYTGDGFYETNKALRRGDTTGWEIARIDSAMRPLPDDLFVKRSLTLDAFPGGADAIDDLVGKAITDRAYMSTSLGSPYSPLDQVTMRIAVPKGTRGIAMAGVSQNPHEREVLLDRGLELVVTKVERTDIGTVKIWAVVLPQEAK